MKKAKTIGVALWVVLLLVSCGEPPTLPPTPTPTPTPSTPPTPLPTMRISIQGNSFHPTLVGMGVCCDDPSTPGVDEGLRDGWTLITRERIQTFAAFGVNFTILRTGPYREGSPTMQDLAFTVDLLDMEGMGAEVDLVDAWELRVTGRCWETHGPPRDRFLRHVRAVVEATASFENLIYNVGNEAYTCEPSDEWYEGIAGEARKAGARIVGGDRDLKGLDYLSIHGAPRGVGGGTKPHFLNESDGGHYAPEVFVAAMKESAGLGSVTLYWRGPQNDAEVARGLGLIKEWRGR